MLLPSLHLLMQGGGCLFIISCPHLRVISTHYVNGAESISDFFTILICGFTLEQLRGVTIIFDNGCHLLE
jgi:hypothetical protein